MHKSMFGVDKHFDIIHELVHYAQKVAFAGL